MTLNNNGIRRDILKLLYQNFRTGARYTEGADMIASINYDKTDIYSNLRYLEGKGLVNVIWRTGGFPVTKINAIGIDLLEDESEFNRKFPVSIKYDSSINISNVSGTLTGIGVSGSNHIIRNSTHITDSFNVENDLLAKLPKEYSNALLNFHQNIEKEIKEHNVPEDKKNEIQNSLTDLIKETQGMDPDKEPGILKQQSWREKFFGILRSVLPVLPKTAETIAAFTPLAPFSKIIGNSVQGVVQQVQKEL